MQQTWGLKLVHFFFQSSMCFRQKLLWGNFIDIFIKVQNCNSFFRFINNPSVRLFYRFSIVWLFLVNILFSCHWRDKTVVRSVSSVFSYRFYYIVKNSNSNVGQFLNGKIGHRNSGLTATFILFMNLISIGFNISLLIIFMTSVY